MIRLTVVLCGGLFLFLLIAGQDHGQMRQGLISRPLPDATQAEVQDAAVTHTQQQAEIQKAVFVPLQPVRVVQKPETAAIATTARRTETAAETSVEAAPVALQAEPQPDNRLAVVNTKAINVRAGPSTEHEIIGRLTRGEQVLIVVDQNTVEGWSVVRIEGDGITGYVATRLLQPLDER